MEKKKIKVIDITPPEKKQETIAIKKEEPVIAPKREEVKEAIKAEISEIKIEPKHEEIIEKKEINPILKDFVAMDFKKFYLGDSEESLKNEEKKDNEEVKIEDRRETSAFAPELKKKDSKIKKYIIIAILLLFVGGMAYASLEILPRVEIKIVAKKYLFSYNDWITASKNVSAADVASRQIPAEVFSEKKNISLAFSASGKKAVQRKASGEITIYNAYSSDPQAIIAGTRFETSDGKIFRINSKITIPGAKIKNGKIESSNIKAQVTADKAGVEYNINPTEKFTIPGFKGTPKYDGFYASSEQAMKGGLIGELLYPTDSDIKTAKEKITAVLKENLISFLSSQISKDFKILDGSEQFTILKEKYDQEADESGNFLYSLEGSMQIIAFKESDILELMAGLENANLAVKQANLKAKDYKIQYSSSRPDFNNGRLSISLNYDGSFWQPIDTGIFRNSIIKKEESDLKTTIFAMGNVEKATVSFWPFWVKTVPNDLNRIKISVE